MQQEDKSNLIQEYQNKLESIEEKLKGEKEDSEAKYRSHEKLISSL